MLDLLRASFFRLRKNRSFLLLAAFMVLIGIAIPLKHLLSHDTEWILDFSFFTYMLLESVLAAVLTALFVGGEYSDGTMRNKLIAGHRRSSIYLTNLITCTAAGILLCVAHIVPHAVLGLLTCRFEAAAGVVFCYIGLSFALTAAFAALFTMIAMLCRSKSHTTAACILLSVLLLLWGVQITSALNEPEVFPAYTYVDTATGTATEQPAMRNPNYLSGTKRQVYVFLRNFTPGGQALQIAGMSADTPGRLALYDGVILLAATGCGLAVFRRRNLK